MTPADVVKKVFDLIDEECSPENMSKEDYLEVLQTVRDDADVRADSVEMEIEDQNIDDES